MNISRLTESQSRVFVDQNLPNLPKEVEDLIRDIEYSFYIMGPMEESEYYDFSNNQLYKKDGAKIENLNYTGEVYFGDIFYLSGDKDLSLIYKATFIKGMLDEIHAHTEDYLDNELRKKEIQRLIKEITYRQSMENKFAYKWLYRPYKSVIGFTFILTRSLSFSIFKCIDTAIVYLLKILIPI